MNQIRWEVYWTRDEQSGLQLQDVPLKLKIVKPLSAKIFLAFFFFLDWSSCIVQLADRTGCGILRKIKNVDTSLQKALLFHFLGLVPLFDQDGIVLSSELKHDQKWGKVEGQHFFGCCLSAFPHGTKGKLVCLKSPFTQEDRICRIPEPAITEK